MEKTSFEKLTKTAKAVSVLVKIARVAMYIAGSVMLVFAIIGMITGTTGVILKIGSTTIYSPFTDVGDEAELATLVADFMAAAVLFALLIAMTYIADRMLKSVLGGTTPFVTDNVKSLRKIGVLTILASIIPVLVGNIIAAVYAIAKGFDIETGAEFKFGYIILALVVFLLAGVFEYGCVLQQQSDETL